MLKKTFTALLLVVLMNTPASGFRQGAPWQKFNSPEGKFNILMPSEPKLEVKDVDSAIGKLTLYAYASSNSTGHFLVSYGDFPVDPKDAAQMEAVLDNVRKGILGGLKGELVSEKKVSLYSYPGREFIARGTTQGVEFVYNWKLLLVGRRLYQVAVVTAQKDSASPDVAKFLTSFDLNK